MNSAAEKPKAKKTAPQQRSADWLRKQGYICESTEKTNRYPSREKPGTWVVYKRDLFNFCDLLAVYPAKSGTLYLQVTAGMSHKGERQTKIEQCPAVMSILRAGNTIELHIWRKMGPRGVKVKNWKVARFQLRECFPATGSGETSQFVWIQVYDDGAEEIDASRETPSLFDAAEVFKPS